MQGLGRKRGRYKGVWRERWFLLRGDVLAYWECEADMHRGEKHRGEHTVVSARAVDDAPEEPYCVALHVGLGGLLRSRVQEEFIGFPTDAERDAWLAALAAAHPAGADDETDDDVWVDLDRRPRQRTDVETAVVYDYSVVRSGWRVRVLYHIQVTESGTRGGDPEPWSIRKAQSDFRALLAALPPAVAQAQARDRPEGLSLAESFAELGRGAQDDDAVGPGMDRRGDRRGPMNKPTRLLSSALLVGDSAGKHRNDCLGSTRRGGDAGGTRTKTDAVGAARPFAQRRLGLHPPRRVPALHGRRAAVLAARRGARVRCPKGRR